MVASGKIAKLYKGKYYKPEKYALWQPSTLSGKSKSTTFIFSKLPPTPPLTCVNDTTILYNRVALTYTIKAIFGK